jgi:hypothetical protein
MVSKNAQGCTKMHRMVSALTFLEQHHKGGNEFLNHNVQVAGDETWVSFVNVKTKDNLKQWMHKHSPNKPKKFKQMLVARKIMETVFPDREC